MCQDPSLIPEVGFVACRKCWQCCERKVDDWVGRNIAEGKTAKAAHVVTLTYGEDLSIGGVDHIRAAVLTYSDVQKFLKYLRVEGYPVRYFVVGEYGSMKGRAHWHIILYWQGAVPEHTLRENFMWKFWPHGWAYFDKMSPEAIRYACKYVMKDMQDDYRQGFGPMPSKKPPLGDAYLRRLAKQYVDAGLSPQNLFYSFPEVLGRDRKPKQFLLGGVSATNFCDYFLQAWEAAHGDRPYPNSDMIDERLDELAAPLLEALKWDDVVSKAKAEKAKGRPIGYANWLYGLWRQTEREIDVEEEKARGRASEKRDSRFGWSLARSLAEAEEDGSYFLEPRERIIPEPGEENQAAAD